MTDLPIHITPHRLNLSPSSRKLVRRKFAKLHRIANDAVEAEIVLRRHRGSEGERFTASARLALPGSDLHGSATHAELDAAVRKMAAILARRSRKRKARPANRRLERIPNRRLGA
jgi:ribosomal subunit interface protein